MQRAANSEVGCVEGCRTSSGRCTVYGTLQWWLLPRIPRAICHSPSTASLRYFFLPNRSPNLPTRVPWTLFFTFVLRPSCRHVCFGLDRSLHNFVFMAPRVHSNLSSFHFARRACGAIPLYFTAGTVLKIAARMKVEKDVMKEQREAEEELAVFMNRRLVKEVRTLVAQYTSRLSSDHHIRNAASQSQHH